MVQSSSTTLDGAAKWRNRTFRRFQVADLWTTPPGPVWSRGVQPGPGWSSRGPVGSGPPAGRQNGALSKAGSGIEPRRAQTVRSGMRRRSQRVSKGGVAHPQAGGQWTRLDHPSLVQGGPGWSRQRGVGGAQPIIPERCAIDAQCDSAPIGRVWAGAACMQPTLSWVGRRPGHSNVSTLSTHI